MQSLEEQNELIKANLHNMSVNQIKDIKKQLESYNANTLGAYDTVIEYLGNELISRGV